MSINTVYTTVWNLSSLLEVVINYNVRDSLGIPDTSMMVEGNKTYVYKVSKDNIANKTEIKPSRPSKAGNIK